ncbi:yippee family protein [Ceratocystis lukuohia]|uniref:Yippee family protein n=1 Tax=Ceratocystis lukuohia TaxID=2019550 RepID=A0ABR4MU75_9PEZI
MQFRKPKKSPTTRNRLREPKRFVPNPSASLLLRGLVSYESRRSCSPTATTTAPALPTTAHTANESLPTANPYAHPDLPSAPAPHLDTPPQQLIVSWGFHGRHGRCMLVAPPSQAGVGAAVKLDNLMEGQVETRDLTTGWHKIANVNCLGCKRYVGWYYLDAVSDEAQYKIDDEFHVSGSIADPHEVLACNPVPRLV